MSFQETNMRTHRFLKAVLTAVAAFSLSSALAQNYPNKTINLIVPYPAGGQIGRAHV